MLLPLPLLALDAHLSLALTLEATARRDALPTVDRLRRLGVGFDEALALAGLGDADGTSVHRLAVRLRRPVPFIATAIARLAALGRVEHDGDEVWLTRRGRLLRARLGEPYGLA